MANDNPISFADLRIWYSTGRSYVISGTGRNRKYGYRNGKMCNLGDLKESEWKQMAKALIRKSGEQELYQQLLHFMAEHNCTHDTASQLESKCLELHMARIFDNRRWIYFIPFNRLYRPHILTNVELISVIPSCCKKPGEITAELLDSFDGHTAQGVCPHCYRHTSLKICGKRKTA